MAIQFARIEIVGRSSGGSACCKGAYNARTIIKDQKTNITYNFLNRGDNVYHEILLPDGVDRKFKNTKMLMNEVERTEKRKDSQLLKDIVIALPDDKELTLEDRIIITHRLIEKREWVKEGLAVQVDIHEPHDGDKNWHAHLLVTTRRFTADGLSLGAKAVDLNPQFKKAGNKAYIVPEDQQIHEDLKEIINDYFKELGLENRVDSIGINPQEHIGPIRMRSLLNQAMDRNEERRNAEIEHLNNGRAVLGKVTRHISVFSRGDLMRAVKCVPNIETRGRLVEDALNNKEIVPLYHEGGGKSGFYTTNEVREEELKLIRLGGYIANQKNLMTRDSRLEPSIIAKIISEDKSLIKQQQEALLHLTLGGSGVKILKGRAGTGKSHVLGKLASIANYSQVNVIGLAPTHKAVRELVAVGYNKCDTIKGFLFKLYNAKVDLPKNSLIVIDEAGMVANDDYSEILRVLAAKSCNVILAGDELQLSSISRGGMFEVFADKFGSYEMNDIRRQESEWSKDIALAFSEGNIRCGIDILKSNNRLNNADTKIDSMESLLNSWNNSSEALEHRLIIAVKNTDVDTLNAGARELLKAKNILSGSEVLITKDTKDYCFMKNDRIVFNQSNKEIKVSNGDFGIVKSLSSSKFTVTLDSKIEIEFDPSEFSGFKHGYASTVYKAQGSSIRDVYVLHDGFSTSKNSYVAMSRHINDIHLYTNKVATNTDNQLIKQLGFNPETGSSLNYYTKEDLEAKRLVESRNVLAKTYDKFSSKLKSGITSFIDKSSVDRDYYVFEKPEISKAEAFEILELVNEYKESSARSSSMADEEEAFVLEERAVVGSYNINQKGKDNTNITTTSNNITQPDSKNSSISNTTLVFNITSTTKMSMTPKERFYANKDYLLKKQAANNIDYEQKNQNLRQEIKWDAETIALNLLGEPNKRLSDGRHLRFGQQGGIAVLISGEKSGNWYNFEKGIGGDLVDLVQDNRNCDFKEAVSYLHDTLGISGSSSLQLVWDSEASNKYVDHYEQAIEKQKIHKVEDLVNSIVSIEEGGPTHWDVKEDSEIGHALVADNIEKYNLVEEQILIAANNDGPNSSSYLSVIKASEELKSKGEILKVIIPKTLGDFNDVLTQEEVKFTREIVEPELNFLQSVESVIEKGVTVFNEMENTQHDLKSFEAEEIDHNISIAKHITKEFTPSLNKEIDNFLELNCDKLADIASLNPKYDINSLKTNLEPLDKKEREVYIESTWLETFKHSVLPELEDINKRRLEAKTVDELAILLVREKEFCLKTYDQYWRLSVNLEYQEKNDHITRINALYHNKPELLESFVRDAHNVSKFGIWDQDRVMDEINRDKGGIITASGNLFTLCQTHIIKGIDKDLHHFKHNEFLEHRGIKFDSAKSYLEHKMHDDHINCYLKGTRVATTLQNIYRHEQHLEQQKQLELVHHIEKGIGMDM